MRRSVFAANWKMNKRVSEAAAFVNALEHELALDDRIHRNSTVILAPSATHLETVSRLLGETNIELGAQNCGTTRFGAFTGENSPAALHELGCHWVILGHSERRHVFKEDDAQIVARAKAALQDKLKVIYCVGELLQDRKSGQTTQVIESQLSALKTGELPAGFLDHFVLAYEPVWAIGTGETATAAQAQEVHAFIRQWLTKNFDVQTSERCRVLYGGSVKPENAASIMAEKDVDGLLVGTASLDPLVFAGVIRNGLKPKLERSSG